eukprot:9370166-Pyramimonas_sp.AAC.1
METQFESSVELEDKQESTLKEAFSSSWGNRKLLQIASKLFRKQKITEPKGKDEERSALWE